MEIRPLARDQLNAALDLIVDEPGLRASQRRRQVRAFRDYLDRKGLTDLPQLAAFEDGGMLTAVLCLDSPGKTALVFTPPLRTDEQGRAATIDVLHQTVRRARDRGMKLFQALLPTDALEDHALYAECGFEQLADLIYLERPTTLPLPKLPEPEGLSWVRYSRQTHAMFCSVVQQTYEETLDCPRLTGLRDIEDVLAGHKDTGRFDPDNWLVFRYLGESVGCILLARVDNRPALEVVYTGVSPRYRRRSFGRIMIQRAHQLAVDQRLVYLTLAVDSRNAPARRLYDELGFTETMRRSAWVLIP